jgi:hypothetical protein
VYEYGGGTFGDPTAEACSHLAVALLLQPLIVTSFRIGFVMYLRVSIGFILIVKLASRSLGICTHRASLRCVFEYVLSGVRDGEKLSRKSWEKLGTLMLIECFDHMHFCEAQFCCNHASNGAHDPWMEH